MNLITELKKEIAGAESRKRKRARISVDRLKRIVKELEGGECTEERAGLSLQKENESLRRTLGMTGDYIKKLLGGDASSQYPAWEGMIPSIRRTIKTVTGSDID